MDVALILYIFHHFGAILIIYESVVFVRSHGLFWLQQNVENSPILKMNIDVGTLFFDAAHFIYVEGVEQHFLLFFKRCWGQFIDIDIHKAMIVFVPTFHNLHLFHMNNKDVAIFICKFLCALKALGSWHKPIHFYENSGL